MNQHLSPLSHMPVRGHLESSWDLVSMESLGSSMKPWSPLVADASISGSSWNSSPAIEQQGYGIHPRTVVSQVSLISDTTSGLVSIVKHIGAEQGTRLNVYNAQILAQIGHFSKHHPTLSPSNEVRKKFVHEIPSKFKCLDFRPQYNNRHIHFSTLLLRAAGRQPESKPITSAR